MFIYFVHSLSKILNLPKNLFILLSCQVANLGPNPKKFALVEWGLRILLYNSTISTFLLISLDKVLIASQKLKFINYGFSSTKSLNFRLISFIYSVDLLTQT